MSLKTRQAVVSPTGMAHMAGNLPPDRTTGIIEIMTFGLSCDCRVDRIDERDIVIRFLPQNGPQVYGAFLAEALVQSSDTIQPDTVAALAEVVAERRDKPDLLTGFDQAA